MLFFKLLLFKPNELGHITHFATFDTRRAGMCTPNQVESFWDNTIHASASYTVLKQLTRTFLTQDKTVRNTNPGNFEPLLSLDDRLLMDQLLTPSFFVDKFKENSGLLGYYIQCLRIFFDCVLFGKVFN